MGKREAHVRRLAKRLGATLDLQREPHYLYGVAGEYSPESHKVIVQGWDGRSQKAYFVALHELGHAYLRSPRRSILMPPEDILLDEAAAWQYAIERSHEKPSKVTADWITSKECLASYIRTYGHGWLPEVQNVIGSIRQAAHSKG